jgi:hypothetical protein
MRDSAHLSDDTQDKLQACLNQTRAESDYIYAWDYYDACVAWWDELMPDQLRAAMAVLDTYSFEHPQASEKIAATLPAAPKCPLYVRGIAMDTKGSPANETVLKLHAAVVLSDDPPDIAMPSRYLEGCKRWFAALSDSQKLVALEMVRVLNSGDEDKALSMAAALPAAPHL